MSGFDLFIERLRVLDCEPREFTNGWRAKCPSHGSKGGTLKVVDRGGKPLFHCFAGCEYQLVLESMGLKWGDLVEDRPVSEWRPRRREKRVVAGFENPVENAKRYARLLYPVGGLCFAGSCACGGMVSSGPSGSVCVNGCPVDEVGRWLIDWSDAGLMLKGCCMSVEIRSLNVLGCTEKKRGTSKAGNEYVIYSVHADDGLGNPLGIELQSFNLLPVGVGEYAIEKNEGQWGTTYTVKNPNPQTRMFVDFNARLARIEAHLNLGAPAVPAQPAAPAPVAAPVVVESSEIPF